MAEAYSLAESLGDPVAQFFAAAYRAWASIQAGDLDEVDRRLEQMSRWARQLCQPLIEYFVAFYQAWRSLLAGEQERSEAWATRALQVANNSGNPDGMVFYVGQLFAIRRNQGRLNELVDMIVQVSTDNPGVPVLRATLATAFCELDRDDEAHRLLEAEAATGFTAHPLDVEWLHAMTRWADVCVHLRATESAELLYQQLAPFAHQIAFSGVTVSGSVSHSLGGLAGLLGRCQDAEEHLARASEVHERLRAPYHLALTRLSWARMLLARSAPGDAARAAKLARWAHTAARQHGFGTVERRTATMIALDDRWARSGEGSGAA
jgi:tetratricopeptide (TPR) repeat protein